MIIQSHSGDVHRHSASVETVWFDHSPAAPQLLTGPSVISRKQIRENNKQASITTSNIHGFHPESSATWSDLRI